MYYTIENGKDERLDTAYDKEKAIEVCKTIGGKEVFEYTNDDEMVSCVYSKKNNK